MPRVDATPAMPRKSAMVMRATMRVAMKVKRRKDEHDNGRSETRRTMITRTAR